MATIEIIYKNGNALTIEATDDTASVEKGMLTYIGKNGISRDGITGLLTNHMESVKINGEEQKLFDYETAIDETVEDIIYHTADMAEEDITDMHLNLWTSDLIYNRYGDDLCIDARNHIVKNAIKQYKAL